MSGVRHTIRGSYNVIAGAFMLIVLVPMALIARAVRRPRSKPKLLFGAASIASLPAIASAMRSIGFVASAAAVAGPAMPEPKNFDRVVENTGRQNRLRRRTLGYLESAAAFLWAINRFDVFCLFFSGGLLRKTPLCLLELKLLRLAGKRIILFPYGSDAFAIDRIPYATWRQVLLSDYPELGRNSREIERRLDIFSADVHRIVACLVHIVSLPRWDDLMLTCYPVDVEQLQPHYPNPADDVVRVFHAPNHRAIKGTDALVSAIERLKGEGVAIELDLAEARPHPEILDRMRRSHIVVDQLHFGYGLTAMEAMALGKIVITGRNPPEHDEVFNRQLGFDRCPVLRETPESIFLALKNLCENRKAWPALARSLRRFAEERHAPAVVARNWAAVIGRLGMV